MSQPVYTIRPMTVDDLAQVQAQRGMLEFRYKFQGLYMFHAHKTEFAELGWTGNFLVEA